MSKFNQIDDTVDRDRVSRMIVAVASPLLAVLLGYMVGVSFAAFFGLPLVIGYTGGLGLGAFVGVWLISKSYITNGTVVAFVTLNPLITAFGSGNPLVTYGPGFHFCYWWEKRDGGNTVDLGEAAETYSAVIQVPSGKFTVKYSVRLRPDIERLPEFLSGVASIAAELGGIISAQIIDFVNIKNDHGRPLTISEAIASLAKLNGYLKCEFEHGKVHGDDASDFEKRFGVMIGDVTAEEILPSKEVQETMSAVTEAEVIDKIVANSFGYDDVKALRAAVLAKEVKDEEINRRRTQTLAMSGNLQGMDLKEHTFNLQIQGLNDIDPALIHAITAAAPALAAVAHTLGGKNGAKPKGAK